MDISKIPEQYLDHLPSLDTYLTERLTDEHKLFYIHLLKERYKTDEEFSVDFDVLWRDVGYTRKDNAKTFLKKHLKEYVEYKALLRSQEVTEACSAPVNKETILLTIEAAQKFAMMSGTEKSKVVINFFITFVKIVQDYHCITLHHEKNDAVRKAAMFERHKTLLQSFANKPVLYQAYIGMVEGEDVDKFGHTGDIQTRISKHQSEIGSDTVLLDVIEHKDRHLLERHVKNDPVIKRYIRTYKINGKNQTELIAFDKTFTRDKYRKRVLKIIEDMLTYTDTSLELEKLKIQSQLEMEKQKTLQMQTELETLKLQLEIKRLDMQCNNTTDQEQQHADGDQKDNDKIDEVEEPVNGIRPLFRKDPRHMKPITPEEYKFKRDLIRANSLKNGINAATSYVSQTICPAAKFKSKQNLIKLQRQGISKMDIAIDEIFQPMNDHGKRVLKDIWKEKNTTKGCSFTTKDLFEASLRYLFRNFPEFTNDDDIYAID